MISAFPSPWVARFAALPVFPGRSIIAPHDGDTAHLQDLANRILDRLRAGATGYLHAAPRGPDLVGDRPLHRDRARGAVARRHCRDAAAGLAGRPMSLCNGIGTARRLRALMAIGYTQGQLAAELDTDQSRVSKLMLNSGARITTGTRDRVVELYDRLSMTPGPSQQARNRAQRKGWPPPLAWDDDVIDDPHGQPAKTHRQRWVPWDEKYKELRQLGYSDLQILDRLRIQPESMLRQLHRYSIKPSPELVNLGASMKHKKRMAS